GIRIPAAVATRLGISPTHQMRRAARSYLPVTVRAERVPPLVRHARASSKTPSRPLGGLCYPVGGGVVSGVRRDVRVRREGGGRDRRGHLSRAQMGAGAAQPLLRLVLRLRRTAPLADRPPERGEWRIGVMEPNRYLDALEDILGKLIAAFDRCGAGGGYFSQLD